MTLLLGFAAVNTGNNLLYLLVSALLGFMAVSGWLGQQNLRRLEVEFHFPSEIFATQPTLVGVRLYNRRARLPAFLVRLNLGVEKPLFAWIAAGGWSEGSLTLSWPYRGTRHLDDLWLESCYPINFFVRSLRVPVDQSLLVFPLPQREKMTTAEGGEGQPLVQNSRRRGDSSDLRSVQDYRGGEPLKSIHWKLSARHDSYKVKLHEGFSTRPLMIDIDQLQGSLEQRISQAAGLVVEQLRRQQPVGLQLGSERIPPGLGRGQRRRLLSQLAVYHGR
jgi:uncharacterized protein (DUF58 family)